MVKCHLDEPLPLGVGDSPTLSHSIHALISTQTKRPLQKDVTRTVDSILFHAHISHWRYRFPRQHHRRSQFPTRVRFLALPLTKNCICPCINHGHLIHYSGPEDGKIAQRTSHLVCIACRFHFSCFLQTTVFPIMSFVFCHHPRAGRVAFDNRFTLLL